MVTLCAGLDEGVANDWFGLSLVKGYHQTQAVGALGFGVFVASMTVGRTVGTSVIDRFGRVRTLRLTATIAAAGILLVVIGPWVGIALLGGVLWGAGAALGFPMGMSAAADDPVWSAPRVGVVASIGYVAFLAGPPLVGFVADGVGVRRAVGVVLVAPRRHGRPGAGRAPARAQRRGRHGCAQRQRRRRLDLLKLEVRRELLAAAEGQVAEHLLQLGHVPRHDRQQVVHLAGHQVGRDDLRHRAEHVLERLAGPRVVTGQRRRDVHLEREARPRPGRAGR